MVTALGAGTLENREGGSMKKLIVIDGNSLANRAFYAIPVLNNSQGVPTNAVYGFTNMLMTLINHP